MGKRTTLLEVRVGKVRPLGNTEFRSAIAKTLCSGPVSVSTHKVEGDEQGTPEIHGGPEKAVLQYALHHYTDWRQEFPGHAALFKAGGFGENFVANEFDETNVCIGDVFEVGSLVLQVAQPRQPCFKLNHRFQQATMSVRTQQTGRTGWYYRVLQAGTVTAGDDIALVDRPHPEWTIASVQRFLYQQVCDTSAMSALVQLEFLAPGMRSLFERRLETKVVENWGGRLLADPDRTISPADIAQTISTGSRTMRVKDIALEAANVISIELVATDRQLLDEPQPGSHLRITLPNGLERSYSLCAGSGRESYRIAVALDRSGRGGSRWLHESLRVGQTLIASAPMDAFPVAASASCHVLIAGGIGITPFTTMIEHFRRVGARFKLYYCARSEEAAPFLEQLEQYANEEISFHSSSKGAASRLDIQMLIDSLSTEDHVYCCGPERLMNAVRDAVVDLPAAQVHFEAFAATGNVGNGSSFTVEIASSGAKLNVEANQSVLRALQRHGIAVPSSCETGSCGTCVMGYRSGTVGHRDFCLSKAEQTTRFTPCVSRATTTHLLLDI